MRNLASHHRRRFLFLLTVFRIPAALLFFFLLETPTRDRLTIALCCLLTMELSDFLDGHLARRWQLTSRMGEILDPYADSISRLIVFFGLLRVEWVLAGVPLVMALRDITVVYARLLQQNSGKRLAARLSGKAKALAQGLGALGLVAYGIYWGGVGPGMRYLVSWFVIAFTLVSAMDYGVWALRGRLRNE